MLPFATIILVVFVGMIIEGRSNVKNSLASVDEEIRVAYAQGIARRVADLTEKKSGLTDNIANVRYSTGYYLLVLFKQ